MPLPCFPAVRPERPLGRMAMLALGSAALLSACGQPPPQLPPPAPRAETVEASEDSRRLAQYYAAVEQRLLSRGLLRTDGGGPDTPFTARMLAENFERIALYDEYQVAAGRFVAAETPSRLRRWKQPIRMQIVFGASVAPEQREADRDLVAAYIRRLSRLTGLSIILSDADPNFHVFVVNLDEQRTLAPRLSADIPRVPDVVVNEIVNSPRSTFCAAYALSEPDGGSAYIQAIVHIKAEHQGLMRTACFHEEIAQALGLPNDSSRARPSIFNDDEEFALLTGHDELLLRILYDRRLSPGMTPAEARPIVQQIARELIGGDS